MIINTVVAARLHPYATSTAKVLLPKIRVIVLVAGKVGRAVARVADEGCAVVLTWFVEFRGYYRVVVAIAVVDLVLFMRREDAVVGSVLYRPGVDVLMKVG